MPHEWLFEVLRDIEDYVVANKIDWLVPLVNKVNVAANAEARRSGAHEPHMQDTFEGANSHAIEGTSALGSDQR